MQSGNKQSAQTMSEHQRRDSAIEIRFRVDAPRPAPPGWRKVLLVAVMVGSSAGWLLWDHGRRWMLRELQRQLADPQHPAEALLAIEAARQLPADGALMLVDALAHPDPAVALAAHDVLREKTEVWLQSDAAEAVDRIRLLLDRLSALPEALTSEGEMHLRMLATRVAAACQQREGQEWKKLESALRELVLRRGGQATAAALEIDSAMVDASAVPPQATRSSSAGLQTPPPPPTSELSDDQQGATTNRPQAAGVPGAAGDFPSAVSATLSDGRANDEFPPTAFSAREASAAESGPAGESSAGHGATQQPVVQMPSYRRVVGGTKEDAENAAALVSLAAPPAAPAPTEKPDSSGAMPSARYRLISNTDGMVPAGQATNLQPTAVVVHRMADAPLKRMVVDEPVTLEGIDRLPDDQLVRLLGSIQPKIGQAATLALKSRGWSDQDLELAVTLARGSKTVRLELLDVILRREDLNPRQWLLWMASDGQAEVRGRAVALLGTMMDEEVRRQLRMLLSRENDEAVRQAIRQALLAGNRP
ncbi:MAG: hypothetical protein KatS3mg111_3721 [Pirellulaceae bacterium]|nr:MAG: hypothetical protein KatS3mg111_3721 [Pirellulaceae bacterium]